MVMSIHRLRVPAIRIIRILFCRRPVSGGPKIKIGRSHNNFARF